jgi:nucleotide-binding universal stress UspA family protein
VDFGQSSSICGATKEDDHQPGDQSGTKLQEAVMLPARTILHPTDFSAHSEYAFRIACALAHDYEARLIVVHVLHAVPPARTDGGGGQARSPWPDEHRSSLWEKLERLPLHYPGVRIERRLVEGGIAEEILRMAEEYRCDLVVMGTHGRTGLDRMLMGSVAEEVLRRARCPVLAVKDPSTWRHREPVWAELGLKGAS